MSVKSWRILTVALQVFLLVLWWAVAIMKFPAAIYLSKVLILVAASLALAELNHTLYEKAGWR